MVRTSPIAVLIVLLMTISGSQLRAELPEKEIAGVKIPIPPSHHPRLYLRVEDLPKLQSRLEDPVLKPAVERLQSLARRRPQFQLEWDALQFLVAGDRDLGRATVEKTLALLNRTELPDRQDGCRVTGRMMVTGAVVYDWLYPLLTPKEKQSYIAELVRLAKTLECGYPPTRQGSVTGHSSEAMIMRDMISAGIAVYDEFPEMYELAAGRFFREHVPARNWLYNGHAYHQGDSYGPYRYSWDTMPLWIFDRLGAGNVFNAQQRFVPYRWIYTTRPDGQRLRAGDTFCHSAARGKPWGVGPGAVLTASYYGDGYLLSHHLDQGGVRDNEVLFEVLWRDTALKPKPISELPPSRYFGPPFGWMVARTGWDENAVIAEMKVNTYNFNNHQHLDAGAFQIYYKGALAIDSGVYKGSSGAYGSPHCTNYYWRTVAHNCLLVHDPSEVFNPRGNYGNDGGQRLPNRRSEPRTLEVLLDPASGYRTGKVLAQGFGPSPQRPDYTLLKGDITAAYGGKVKSVIRSFVFLETGWHRPRTPAVLIVFDRIVATDPTFRKYWLLHSLEEPRILGTAATVDRTEHSQRGRLVLQSLLPEAGNLRIEKIGGPGKEYRVFGRDFTNDVEPEARRRSSMETGQWRIQISPKQPAAEDLLLSVMQVTDRLDADTFPVDRIDTGAYVGCRLEGPQCGDWAVLFRKDGGRSTEKIELEIPGQTRYKLLVTDLAGGRWQATRDGSEPQTLHVSNQTGAAWFEVQAGKWTLAPE